MATIKHILFPFDFSPRAEETAHAVRTFADRFGAKVTVISVVPPTFDISAVGVGPGRGDTTAEWIATLQARLDRTSIEALTGLDVARVADSGDPAFRVTSFAETHGIDLIMMPTHGMGRFRNLLVGSVTSKVLHDAACPVWTSAHIEAQPAGSSLPKSVMCALDGTASNVSLMQWAADFCKETGAALKLLHVVRPVTDWPSLASEQALQEEVRQEALSGVEALRQKAGVEAPLRVAVGEISTAVVEEARQDNTDLLVIGRGTLASDLGRLRTHAYSIIQKSPCPVISV